MVERSSLDSQLLSCISLLNDVQKQALLVVAKAFRQDDEDKDDPFSWEHDSSIVAEMESRWSHYKTGGKMYSDKEIDQDVQSLLHALRDK